MLIDWKEISKLEAFQQIYTLAMISPFSASEKQKVLEVADLNEAANTLNEILQIINLVSVRLKSPSKKKLQGDSLKLKAICENTPYKPSIFNKAHNIAFNPRSIEIACSGSMYPDHVVFLGTKTVTAESNEEILRIVETNSLTKLPLIIVPDYGIIIPRDASLEAEEMVLALSLIIDKIPKDSEINYLTKKEEVELINWQEEQYLMKLNNVK